MTKIENEGQGIWEEKYYDENGRSQVTTKSNIKTVSIYKGDYNGESVLEAILKIYLLPKIKALDSQLRWKSANNPVVLSEVYGRTGSSYDGSN